MIENITIGFIPGFIILGFLLVYFLIKWYKHYQENK